MRFPIPLLGLTAQLPLVQQPMPGTPAPSRAPRAFALKEGTDTFSPKDLVSTGPAVFGSVNLAMDR